MRLRGRRARGRTRRGSTRRVSFIRQALWDRLYVVGFRDDEEARSHRIRALERDLEERDRKIAALEAKLEERDEPREVEEGDGAKPTPSASKADAADDRWVIDTHRPHDWVVGVVWLLVCIGLGVHSAEVTGRLTDQLPVLFLVILGLFWFHRNRLILDRRAGTVTRIQTLLFLRWRRVVSYAGKELVVERWSATSSSGKSHANGRVHLDGVKLFSQPMGQAKALAERMARFLNIPCRTVNPTAQQLQRRAELPLMLLFGVGVPLLILTLILKEYLSR